jgi:cell fate regulator YaaT (PSP1 superfamily)
MVVVEGDRGIDAGVIEKIEWMFSVPPRRLLRVLRLASMEEVKRTHHNTFTLGLKAAKHVTALLQNPTELMLRTSVFGEFQNLQGIACEFQLDLKRLTIYYTADSAITREGIVCELHRQFHCRIWITRTDEPKSLFSDLPFRVTR